VDEGLDDEPPLPRDKAELIARIAQARVALADAIAPLSDEQLVTAGPYEGWSVKDHLAHLAAWERGIAALLRRAPRYEAMGVDRDTYLNARSADDVNAVIHAATKDRPLADVLASLKSAQEELLDALAPLSDDDLRKTYSYYQPDEPGEDSGAPIVKWVAGNTYEHYAEHQEWLGASVSQRRAQP
jgi:uncharacterized damage-inducible protein DinB